MTPERWKQIEVLCQSALERDAGDRESFLDEACAGDHELRREISSLLAQNGINKFADTMTLANAPTAEREIGPYTLQQLLGRGGMGEVFLAFDKRLGRDVALKLLPEDLDADPEMKRRFAQEARAASSLNHPNIITIYEIGSDHQRDFIAMEYVEGETLRELLGRGKIDLKRALELVAQCASGLAAAHEAGIIHRDIKPENLMVTRAYHVKILDFGLAKLVEKQRSSLVMNDLTTQKVRAPGAQPATTPGVILGTVAYMSPEQAAGRELDQRTDIFSLGLILYEALTGRRAFPGQTPVDVLHAIINDEPPPAFKISPQLPIEVADILDKALAKEPGERYQHAGDFELDLRRLSRAIDSRSLHSDREQPVIKAKWYRRSLMWTLAGVSLMAAAAALFATWSLGNFNVTKSTAGVFGPLGTITITPLTTDGGHEGDATFAPDGRSIAYVSDRTGNFDIFLKQVAGGPDINLTDNPADDIQPAFSPDGQQIAFVSSRAPSSDIHFPGANAPLLGGAIWVMPTLGRSARRIAEQGNFPSWSPDGSAIIYTSGPWFRRKIYRVASSGGDPEEIPISFGAEQRLPAHLLNPSYSSDRRWILFAGDGAIYVVNAEGGEPRRIAIGTDPAWSHDSQAIVYSSGEGGKNHSLWQIPFDLREGKASGRAEPLTVGRGTDAQPTVSSDGKQIAFTAHDISFNIEVLPFDAETGRALGAPKPLTSGSNVNYFHNFSPDGRSVVFDLRRGGASSIWRVDTGGPPIRLTSDPKFVDLSPKWSPDGETIAFQRQSSNDKGDNSDVWLMMSDGAKPRLLRERASSGVGSSWLSDSSALVIISFVDRQLYVLDLSTKNERRLTNEAAIMPVFTISQDNQWVVYQSTESGTVDLRAVPISGGPSRTVIATPAQDYHPIVSPSGNWLYFQPDHKNLYRVPGPASGWKQSPPEKVTTFPESGLFVEDFQISRDGRQLLYSRGRIAGDIWIMKPGQ